MTSTSGGNKRIFISDIHMGDDRSMKTSVQHPYPYGWLRNNITTLTNFLNDKLQDQDVGQLVVLGDLFDQWVIPADLDPVSKTRDYLQ